MREAALEEGDEDRDCSSREGKEPSSGDDDEGKGGQSPIQKMQACKDDKLFWPRGWDFALSPDGTVQSWDAGAERWTGLNARDTAGKMLADLNGVTAEPVRSLRSALDSLFLAEQECLAMPWHTERTSDIVCDVLPFRSGPGQPWSLKGRFRSSSQPESSRDLPHHEDLAQASTADSFTPNLGQFGTGTAPVVFNTVVSPPAPTRQRASLDLTSSSSPRLGRFSNSHLDAVIRPERGLHPTCMSSSSWQSCMGDLPDQSSEITQLLHNINSPMFTLDMDGTVRDWNGAAERISGRTASEVIGGNVIEELVHEDDREEVWRALQGVKNGEESYPFEFPMMLKDGNESLWLLSVAVQRSSNGDMHGMVCLGQDVTPLRQVVSEISSVAGDLRRIIDHANAPILGIDSTGRINEWNLKMAGICERTKEEMLGLDFLNEFVDASCRSEVQRVFEQALQGAETASYELPVETQQGTRQLLFNATTRRGTHGQITGVIGVGQDISKIRAITRDKERMADELRSLIETANAPIFGVDHHGSVSEWNRKATEILGYAKEEALGQSLVACFIHRVHQKQVQEMLAQALSGQEVGNFELTLYSRSGERREILLNATPRRGPNREVLGVFCVGQEITELNKHRLRSDRIAHDLEQLIETANAPIFSTDKQLNIVEWNGWVARKSGWAKDQVRGRQLTNYIHKESKAVLAKTIEKAARGQSTSNFELKLAPRKLERPVCLLLSATPRLGSQGEVVGVIYAGQDITNIKDLALKKSNFMATVSHELNSPIHGILGLSSTLAASEDLPSTCQRPIELIQNCATRLLDLVSNIIDVCSLTQDKTNQTFSRDKVQLAHTMEEVILMSRTAVDKCGIPVLKEGVELVNTLEEDTLPPIEADGRRCSQLFYCLVTNACKFTQRGTVKVSGHVDAEKEAVVITIEDTGIGIAADNLERVFEPFDQEDTSENRRYEGLGLGLSLSKEVARKHGGDIILESVQGEGSKFHVRLPFKMSEDAEVDQVPLTLSPRSKLTRSNSVALSPFTSEAEGDAAPSAGIERRPSQQPPPLNLPRYCSSSSSSSCCWSPPPSPTLARSPRPCCAAETEQTSPTSSATAVVVAAAEAAAGKVPSLAVAAAAAAVVSAEAASAPSTSTAMAGATATMDSLGALPLPFSRKATDQADADHAFHASEGHSEPFPGLVTKTFNSMPGLRTGSCSAASDLSPEGKLTIGEVRPHHAKECIGVGTQDMLDAFMPLNDVAARNWPDLACGRAVTILTVDDDATNQTLMCSTFGSLGCKVIAASSGAECLTYLDECESLPDVILLDLVMPQLSGLDVLAEVRKQHSIIELPIIMVSAKNSIAAVAKGLRQQCNDWVHKPFDRAELVARVRNQVRLKEQVYAAISKSIGVDTLAQLLPDDVLEQLRRRRNAASHSFSREEMSYLNGHLLEHFQKAVAPQEEDRSSDFGSMEDPEVIRRRRSALLRAGAFTAASGVRNAEGRLDSRKFASCPGAMKTERRREPLAFLSGGSASANLMSEALSEETELSHSSSFDQAAVQSVSTAARIDEASPNRGRRLAPSRFGSMPGSASTKEAPPSSCLMRRSSHPTNEIASHPGMSLSQSARPSGQARTTELPPTFWSSPGALGSSQSQSFPAFPSFSHLQKQQMKEQQHHPHLQQSPQQKPPPHADPTWAICCNIAELAPGSDSGSFAITAPALCLSSDELLWEHEEVQEPVRPSEGQPTASELDEMDDHQHQHQHHNNHQHPPTPTRDNGGAESPNWPLQCLRELSMSDSQRPIIQSSLHSVDSQGRQQFSSNQGEPLVRRNSDGDRRVSFSQASPSRQMTESFLSSNGQETEVSSPAQSHEATTIVQAAPHPLPPNNISELAGPIGRLLPLLQNQNAHLSLELRYKERGLLEADLSLRQKDADIKRLEERCCLLEAELINVRLIANSAAVALGANGLRPHTSMMNDMRLPSMGWSPSSAGIGDSRRLDRCGGGFHVAGLPFGNAGCPTQYPGQGMSWNGLMRGSFSGGPLDFRD